MADSEAAMPILLQGMDDVEDQDMTTEEVPTLELGTTGFLASSTTTNSGTSESLIGQIITPSPFQHHNDSATNDRYRSALQRVTASPSSDVEAWEAIMNECMSLYRTQLLPTISEERNTHKMILDNSPPNSRIAISRNDLLERKLDWVDSCHGHLLKYFPYASNYLITAIEMLLARSALPFESLTGGDDDFDYGGVNNWISSDTQNAAAVKADRIFELVLGVKADGSPAVTGANDNSGNVNGDAIGTDNTNANHDQKEEEGEQDAMQALGGMCTSSVEMWLLYIRKRTRDAKRQALLSHSIPSIDPANPNKPIIKITPAGEELIREWIIGAYETALGNGAAFVTNNHLVWKQYLAFVKSWNIMTTAKGGLPGQDPIVDINHSLQSKQKELLRGIYQRLISLPMLGLDGLWMEYESFEKTQSEQLAAALIAENLPKYQHARSIYLERNRVYKVHSLRFGKLATPPADYEFVDADGVKKEDSEEAYKTKMKDECELLALWKRRCGYERTNPERLSAAELTIRIRQCYKDSICIFMRHIEVWHEWSSWELLNTGGTGASSSSSTAGMNAKKRNISLAVGVLELAQKHIPDSTLLAYAHAQILESQVNNSKKIGETNPSDDAIRVMGEFCERAGNTLGYVLMQRMVRKFRGMKESRAVFSEARRKLQVRPADSLSTSNANTKVKVDDVGESSGNANEEAAAGGATVSKSEENHTARSLVMSRNNFTSSNAIDTNGIDNTSQTLSKSTGFLTWHLYAAHAELEHRLNASPKVASRVFELGLRKHRSFLSTPQYVLLYSKLLSELGEEENLRALLVRSISACEEELELEVDDPSGIGTNKNAASKREALRPLWDFMLKFETTVLCRNGDQNAVQAIEARRRKSLYGPSNESFIGGKLSGDDGEVGLGNQKTSLNETLIRVDGYDINSRISNGLDRMVDTLEVSGVLGHEQVADMYALLASISPGSIWKDDGAGGMSDASYRRRRLFKSEINSFDGISTMATSSASTGASYGSSTSGRLMSAKERLAQSAAQGQNTTVLAAVQSSPEWLRGMLMLLPATLRNYRGAKAPPHMIELALSALRDNPLPAVRPASNGSHLKTNMNGASIKRQRNDDGDSSDDDNVMAGGYGSQFRSRQRARMVGSSTS